MSANETLQWTFGLVSSAGKYMTQEQFGFNLNCSGKSLQKRQIFTLEQLPGKTTVQIKSPFGKYWSANVKGDFTANSDTAGADEQWTILAQSDGRWVFQGPHQYYLTAAADKPTCFAREYGEGEKWTIHLAMHPQVAMKNLNRDRYVHLEGGELRVNEIIPWGDDAMIMLEFHNGKYAIRGSDRKYLAHDGTMTPSVGDNNLFILEFYESKLAFKTTKDKYLQAYGGSGKLCVRRDEVGKDELFLLEDSHPQVQLIGTNGLYASNAQTEEVKCDRPEDKLGDTEVFQMEFGAGKWAFRNTKSFYWSTSGGSTVAANQKQKGTTEYFDVEWHGHQIALKAASGKYVTMKPNGGFVANASSCGDNEKFVCNLVNRPQLVLRSDHGFCASKPTRDVISANAVDPEVFQVSVKNGKYVFKGANGKYWRTDVDGTVSCTGDQAEEYTIQLLAFSKMAIRNANGAFFKSEQAGGFKAVSSSPGASELFEF